ncbi:Ger(x)C family spore germination protein [Sporomusa sp.]|uniref:Ger(x)C family spore germination protein n=1 Tax=Sporomusa sp. TaxID=2078658 RepID=UPI002CC63E3D|nr:Ger(x)C family spore germination protein [Sporomusa sp.]HWR43497.1 Ger(x)C family spore germination protein [Sporomusa sp.]
MKLRLMQWFTVNRIKRLSGWLLLTIVCLPLAGCWDQRELQNRHFALAVAIDAADGSETGPETFVQPYGGKQFRLSVELLDIMPSQGERRSASAPKTHVISNTGRSFLEMTRDMFGQLGNPIAWEHIQVIVISQAALEAGGLDQLLDWFMRETELRWRMRLFVTPGDARSILEYKPPSGEPNGLFLGNMARNYAKNPHVVGTHEDIGFTTVRLDNKAPLVLPKIELADDIIKLGGSAVIKKNGRLAGYLDEYDTMAERFIVGLEKSAIITTSCTDHPDYVYAFELFRHDTRLNPHVSGDNIYYTLDINMYGNIGEMQRCPEPHKHDTGNPEFIRKLELQFAEEVKQTVEHGLKVQQDMGVDVLNFARELKRHYPKKWEEVKDRWHEEVFPTIPVVVSVNVTIHQVGEHK